MGKIDRSRIKNLKKSIDPYLRSGNYYMFYHAQELAKCSDVTYQVGRFAVSL